MFQKLLKHEFAVNRGLFTILLLSMLGAGAIGSVALHILIQMGEAPAIDNEPVWIVALLLLSFLVMAIFMAIAGIIVAATILLIYRFYKRHFSDEGYLTFTLPATGHQILLSSIANIFLWSLIFTLVGLAAYALLLTPPFLLLGELDGNIWSEMRYAMSEVFGDGYVLLFAFMILCSAIGSTILPLLAITIGAQVAKKHKLLAGFGIYYGLNMGISFISSIFSFITRIGDAFIMGAGGTMILTFLLPSLLYLGVGIGGYFLMHYMISRKLNLP